MICPKCQHEQPESKIFSHCGIIFRKYFEHLERIELEKKSVLENENDQEPDNSGKSKNSLF